MTDETLLAAFEDLSLPKSDWNHQAHVRVAFLYVSRHDWHTAVLKFRQGIQRYNQATDTLNALDSGYHETLTLAFLALIRDRLHAVSQNTDSLEFCEAHSELFSKELLGTYYSRDRLLSLAAKFFFVEPDLRPLPRQEEIPCDFQLVEELEKQQVEDLHRLLHAQWWGTRRSLEDVRKMVSHTSLMLGIERRSDGRLIGFCRLLTDFTFRATLYDVMVEKEYQGTGLGKILLDAVACHPELQQVSTLYLNCEPGMIPFYERWGYRKHVGKTLWMIKTQREE